MGTYRVKKAIHQYSLVDLLEILLNKEHQEYLSVLEEFKKRTPSEKELEIAKKGLKIRLQVRNKPLSLFDKINCFIVPFTAKQSLFKTDYREIEEQYESDMQEFIMYGETRRVEELKKWQKYAKITYLVLLPIISFITFTLFQIIKN